MGDLKVLGVGIGGSRWGFKGLGLADSRAQSCGDRLHLQPACKESCRTGDCSHLSLNHTTVL